MGSSGQSTWDSSLESQVELTDGRLDRDLT